MQNAAICAAAREFDGQLWTCTRAPHDSGLHIASVVLSPALGGDTPAAAWNDYGSGTSFLDDTYHEESEAVEPCGACGEPKPNRFKCANPDCVAYGGSVRQQRADASRERAGVDVRTRELRRFYQTRYDGASHDLARALAAQHRSIEVHVVRNRSRTPPAGSAR